jgi:hypothetical protein
MAATCRQKPRELRIPRFGMFNRCDQSRSRDDVWTVIWQPTINCLACLPDLLNWAFWIAGNKSWRSLTGAGLVLVTLSKSSLPGLQTSRFHGNRVAGTRTICPLRDCVRATGFASTSGVRTTPSMITL